MTRDRARRFFDLALASGVLRFGEFVLKSGRVSPYFFNAGLFHSGARLAAIGDLYAETALALRAPFDLVFGPAYKGITLATATATSLARLGHDLPFAFNRKEPKDHGEGGWLIGHPLAGRKVLIIDDVISSGASIREAVTFIQAQGGEPIAVLVALDREEQGQNGRSAVEEIGAELGLLVASIATIADLQTYLRQSAAPPAQQAAIQAYLDRYGVAATAR